MYGLYDTDGILRFTGQDKEACMAYAELFELASLECSLMDIPESETLPVRGLKKRHPLQAKNNN